MVLFAGFILHVCMFSDHMRPTKIELNQLIPQNQLRLFSHQGAINTNRGRKEQVPSAAIRSLVSTEMKDQPIGLKHMTWVHMSKSNKSHKGQRY